VSRTLQQAFEHGINFFDTADIYGQGDSERLLGKIFAPHRQKVLYCSKAGLTIGAPQQIIRYAKLILNPLLRRRPAAAEQTTAIRQQAEQQCFRPDYIQRRIETSLHRLKTDYLDLFLLHNPPSDTIKDGTLFAKLDTLQSKGLIRYYGVSCRTHDDALVCLDNSNITCLQLNLDPVNISTALPLLTQLRSKGIGIIARECLSNRNQAFTAWFQPPEDPDKNKFSPAQLALRAILQCEAIDVALVGMTCRQHLTENLAAIPAS